MIVDLEPYLQTFKMAKTIGRNTNRNDTASISSGVVLGPSVSSIISVADPNRIFFRVDNISNQDFMVKLQAANIDNDIKGISVLKKTGFWEMPVDNIYTGEISAIAIVDAPTALVTEY